MSLATCRECGAEVSDQALACPRCGAPRPANPTWSGSGFEWKSSRTCFGFPLVHIAVGRDIRGKLRVAKGIIAIGQFAVGLVTQDAEAKRFFLSWWDYLGQAMPRR